MSISNQMNYFKMLLYSLLIKKNKNCVVQNPVVPCSPTTWSFKVPKKGPYNVKITAGDAEKKNFVSLTVNGVFIFKNIML